MTTTNKTYFARMDSSFFNFHREARLGEPFSCYRFEKNYNFLEFYEVLTSEVKEIAPTNDGGTIVKTKTGSTYILDVNRLFLRKYSLGYIDKTPKEGKLLSIHQIYDIHGSPYIKKRGVRHYVYEVTQVTEFCYKINCSGGLFYVIKE